MGIAAVLSAMIVSLASCGKKSRVIPRGDMARIYAEMFVIDQRIYFDREARGMADSLLVYEPIFEKYGYTSDDYRQSMAHYIKDPDRYARILRESTVILETRLRELRAEKEKLDLLSKGMAASAVFAPERIFFLSGMANKDLLTVDSLSFFIDSTGALSTSTCRKGTTLYMPDLCSGSCRTLLRQEILSGLWKTALQLLCLRMGAMPPGCLSGS